MNVSQLDCNRVWSDSETQVHMHRFGLFHIACAFVVVIYFAWEISQHLVRWRLPRIYVCGDADTRARIAINGIGIRIRFCVICAQFNKFICEKYSVRYCPILPKLIAKRHTHTHWHILYCIECGVNCVLAGYDLLYSESLRFIRNVYT